MTSSPRDLNNMIDRFRTRSRAVVRRAAEAMVSDHVHHCRVPTEHLGRVLTWTGKVTQITNLGSEFIIEMARTS